MTNDSKPLHQHAIIYGLGAIALQVANIVLMPLYTHYLDTSDFGVLQIIYRIGEMFHICLMVQAVKLATFNLFGHARTAESQKRTAASVAVVTLTAMLVGALVVILSRSWLVARFPGIGDGRMLVCGVLVVMLQASTLMPIAMMQARFESIPFVCATLGIAICHVTLASLAVAKFGWGVWGVLFSLAITHGTFGLVLTLRELTKNSFRPDLDQVRHFVRFSAPMIPVGILSIAMHNGDQLFLMSSAGAAAVGVYAVAYRIAQALETFAIEPLCQIWHPWMYKAYTRPDGAVALGRAATGILAVYVFVGLGLVVMRNEVIDVLSADQYQVAADYIPWLVLAFFFMAASSLTDASFFLTSKTGRRTLVAAGSASLMLVLYMVLIPRLGGMGAAYSTLIGFGANYAVNVFVAQRVYRIHYEYRRLLILLISAIAIAAIASQLANGFIWLVPKTALWLAWPSLLWASGVVRPEEKQLILGLLQRFRTRWRVAGQE